MPAPKIVNIQEAIRWYEEGRPYSWMTEEHERKYNVHISPSAWGNMRRRYGLERRIVRDDDLIPWAVRPEHRHAYPIALLRLEARQRAGHPLRPVDEERLRGWKERLAETGTVLHYEPETEQGWFYVPRREGIDTDLIREPERKTTKRHGTD